MEFLKAWTRPHQNPLVFTRKSFGVFVKNAYIRHRLPDSDSRIPNITSTRELFHTQVLRSTALNESLLKLIFFPAFFLVLNLLSVLTHGCNRINAVYYVPKVYTLHMEYLVTASVYGQASLVSCSQIMGSQSQSPTGVSN